MQVSVRAEPPPDRALLGDVPAAGDLACDSGLIRFATTDVNRALAALIARLDALQVAITDVRVGKATLEDVILEMTGSGPGD